MRLVHRLFQLPFSACVGRSWLVPMPDVASVVVGAAGVLQRAGECVGPAHSGVRCQGGPWLGVCQLLVVS